MVLKEGALGWILAWERGEEELVEAEDIEPFYESRTLPRRMDVSVCCLPVAGSGAQHQAHPVNLPGNAATVVQTPYQYADQIVPERGQADGLGVLAAGQDNWQHLSTPTTTSGIVQAQTPPAYIDYSWLQVSIHLSLKLFSLAPIYFAPLQKLQHFLFFETRNERFRASDSLLVILRCFKD